MYYLQRKIYTENFNISDFILHCWKETFSKILNELGRNRNRKNSENTQDKGWKRKERFQTYLKRNAFAVKRKIVIKPVTETSPNNKHFQTLRRKSTKASARREEEQRPKNQSFEAQALFFFASRTKFPLLENKVLQLENRDPLLENVCSHLAILFSDSANFWLLDSSRSGNVEKGKKPGCLPFCASFDVEVLLTRGQNFCDELALRQRRFLAKSGNNPLPKHSRTCWNWSEFLDCASWEEVASKFTGSEGKRIRGLRCPSSLFREFRCRRCCFFRCFGGEKSWQYHLCRFTVL